MTEPVEKDALRAPEKDPMKFNETLALRRKCFEGVILANSGEEGYWDWRENSLGFMPFQRVQRRDIAFRISPVTRAFRGKSKDFQEVWALTKSLGNSRYFPLML